jgi:hypothetical protein
LKDIKESKEAKETSVSTGELSAPQGIGMAVAFDWGLAVQIFVTPIMAIFMGPSNSLKIPGVNPTLGNVLLFVLAWPVAAGLAFFGEMVRRGRNWTRNIQVVANTLLSVVGIISLLSLYNNLKTGNLWPLVTEVILVIFSPLIAWRLSRPRTGRWFKMVTSAEASKRHGGSWIFFIALWAAAGGILQAIAAMKR